MDDLIDEDSCRAIVVYVDAFNWGVNRAMLITTGEIIGWSWTSNWEKVEL